jgi:hypothetical protein
MTKKVYSGSEIPVVLYLSEDLTTATAITLTVAFPDNTIQDFTGGDITVLGSTLTWYPQNGYMVGEHSFQVTYEDGGVKFKTDIYKETVYKSLKD